jgi:hypothetical protein
VAGSSSRLDVLLIVLRLRVAIADSEENEDDTVPPALAKNQDTGHELSKIIH